MAESDYEDDDEYYLEDDLAYILAGEEGAQNEVDTLAERTMHSPVLINTDPAGLLEPDYDALDWEYETDDYYDGGDGDGDGGKSSGQTIESGAPREKSEVRTRKRKRGGVIEVTETKRRRVKKRRQDEAATATATEEEEENAAEDAPGDTSDGSEGEGEDEGEKAVKETVLAELKRPPVVWRHEGQNTRFPIPVVKDGEGVRVALLRDWRERLKEVEKNGYGVMERVKSQVSVRQVGEKEKNSSVPRNGVREDFEIQKSLKRRRESELVEETADSSPSEDGLMFEEATSEEDFDELAGADADVQEGDIYGTMVDDLVSTHLFRKSKRLKNGG